ncbi:hypothetical protein M0R72_08115 [Candidatus Pacearchaeota archaeon]|jgi:hypothetical protein|nr:hypothetical protein [Candidatus Pacearchaeota archaeon]
MSQQLIYKEDAEAEMLRVMHLHNEYSEAKRKLDATLRKGKAQGGLVSRHVVSGCEVESPVHAGME